MTSAQPSLLSPLKCGISRLCGDGQPQYSSLRRPQKFSARVPQAEGIALIYDAVQSIIGGSAASYFRCASGALRAVRAVQCGALSAQRARPSPKSASKRTKVCNERSPRTTSHPLQRVVVDKKAQRNARSPKARASSVSLRQLSNSRRHICPSFACILP